MTVHPFYLKHYGQLKGSTIIDIAFEDDGDGDMMPVLYCKTPAGKYLIVDVLRDEEGNGRGFLNIEQGLPLKKADGGNR